MAATAAARAWDPSYTIRARHGRRPRRHRLSPLRPSTGDRTPPVAPWPQDLYTGLLTPSAALPAALTPTYEPWKL